MHSMSGFHRRSEKQEGSFLDVIMCGGCCTSNPIKPPPSTYQARAPAEEIVPLSLVKMRHEKYDPNSTYLQYAAVEGRRVIETNHQDLFQKRVPVSGVEYSSSQQYFQQPNTTGITRRSDALLYSWSAEQGLRVDERKAFTSTAFNIQANGPLVSQPAVEVRKLSAEARNYVPPPRKAFEYSMSRSANTMRVPAELLQQDKVGSQLGAGEASHSTRFEGLRRQEEGKKAESPPALLTSTETLTPEELRKQRAAEKRRAFLMQEDNQDPDHNEPADGVAIAGTVVSSSTHGPLHRFDGRTTQHPNEPDASEATERQLLNETSLSNQSTPDLASSLHHASIVSSSNLSPTQLFQQPAPAKLNTFEPHESRARSSPTLSSASTPRLDEAHASSMIDVSNRSPTQLFQGSTPARSPPPPFSLASPPVSRPMNPSEYVARLNAQPGLELGVGVNTSAMSSSNGCPTQLFTGSAPDAAVSSRDVCEDASQPAPLPRHVTNAGVQTQQAAEEGAVIISSASREEAGRSFPDTVMEIESCVLLPCCKSKVPHKKVIKTITETETCPCCGTGGINHSMLLPINPSARTDRTAVVLPCCKSHVPRALAEMMLAPSLTCSVCYAPNVSAHDLQEPIEVSPSCNTHNFVAPQQSKAGKKKKVKKMASASSVYEDVGPSAKFFTQEEIERMTAAQKKAISDATSAAGKDEDGWDQMSLAFVSELLMKEAHDADGMPPRSDPEPAPAADASNQNPLWGLQHSAAPSAGGGGNSGDGVESFKSYAQVKKYAVIAEQQGADEGEKGADGGEAPRAEDEEGWMNMSLSFVSQLLNSEAEERRAS